MGTIGAHHTDRLWGGMGTSYRQTMGWHGHIIQTDYGVAWALHTDRLWGGMGTSYRQTMGWHGFVCFHFYDRPYKCSYNCASIPISVNLLLSAVLILENPCHRGFGTVYPPPPPTHIFPLSSNTLISSCK